MKKVLSVAMASAMVLGMGANAFAITYNTSTNDEADWPEDFQFDGELFVTNKDGDIVKDATTAINDNEVVDFLPGDVIWMPLYADDQLSYSNKWNESTPDKEAISSVRLEPTVVFEVDEVDSADQYWFSGSKWYTFGGMKELSKDDIKKLNADGFYAPSDVAAEDNYNWIKKVVVGVDETEVPGYESDADKIEFDNEMRPVKENSAKYYLNGKSYKSIDAFEDALDDAGEVLLEDVYATVDLVKVDGEDEWVGKPSVDVEEGERAYGLYTGNIDKNWSINLIEGSTGVAELIEKAELYKATNVDYASYSDVTDQIMPNAVYLKITLKDEFKKVTTETLKYYVYVTDNTTGDKTNEVWVSGTYSNKSEVKTVDFTWTNDASQPAIWKVAKNESGVAVFDFADKAFFSVKMYAGETMYLDLSTAYDAAMAGDFNEAEAFYAFDNDNANFSRTGTLVLVSDDASLIPYQVTEDGYVKVDADYVEDYAIAHTNEKVDGFVFETKELGNYVLATDELEVEEDDKDDTQEVVVPDTDNNTNNNSKPNPSTGAEDFVGLAVSLAVVSVAAAGALALKK